MLKPNQRGIVNTYSVNEITEFTSTYVMETIWTYWIHTSWWRMVTSSPCFLGFYSVIHRYYAVPSSRPPSVFVSSFELLLRRIFHFLCFLSGYRNVWMDGEVMRRRKGKAESEHLLPDSALHSLSEHENSCAMKVVQQSDLPDETEFGLWTRLVRLFIPVSHSLENWYDYRRSLSFPQSL